MEFIAGTDEYMFVEVTETTGELTDTFETLGATATFSIYKDDESLVTANAVEEDTAVAEITGNVFKCRINPDVTWDNGKYQLFLKVTNIPGYAEKPRFGPFKFTVLQ